MGNDEPCLEWVSCMPGTTVQEQSILSRNVPLGTGTYYMPEGLSIRPNRNRVSRFPTGYTQGIIAHPTGRQGGRRASTPLENAWWPPDRIQQEQLYNICMATINTEAISIPINFPHPDVSCLNITVSNNVHGAFTKVQYPWLSYYGGQQEYSIRSSVRSLPILGVQVYRSTGVPNIW